MPDRGRQERERTLGTLIRIMILVAVALLLKIALGLFILFHVQLLKGGTRSDPGAAFIFGVNAPRIVDQYRAVQGWGSGQD